MRTKITRLVPHAIMPLGNFRSLPTEMSSAAPVHSVIEPRPIIHSTRLSSTAEFGVKPLPLRSEFILAPKSPLEVLADQAAPQSE
jgi:hypothetical protein